jgi:hypothetical protein
MKEETVGLSPMGAMQSERTLEHLLFHICQANPRYGPVYMAKVNLADGFYHLWLASRDIPNLGTFF